MLSKIKVLDSSEIQKIAAGEVVERPANVLKELIENSLDAQANSITIYLENAGKDLIKVVDNGFGMTYEDAKLCFEHHATSKITSVGDLNKIDTFGFRGEALSSIASVSRVILTTKQDLDQLGIELYIEQNRLEKEIFVNCNTGTTISIKDLFFNVPARKKFLKSKETEYRSIISLFYAFCFSYIDINFKLYHDNKLIYNCPAVKDLSKRLGQLYGYDIAKNFTEIVAENLKDDLKQDYQISGIISNPKYSRYDRGQIYLFVNNRWVKNYKLVQAFIKGYQGMLEVSRYPSGVINIDVDKQEVDINIHPKKEEVQFLHPRLVENLITSNIKRTLELDFNKNLNFQQNISSNFKEIEQEVKDDKNIMAQELVIDDNKLISEEIKVQDYNYNDNVISKNVNIIENDLQSFKNNQELEPQELTNIKYISYSSNENLLIDLKDKFNYKLIGQVLKTYIIIEVDNGLTLIDQHAAHERIIYQKISSNFLDIPKIKLAFPEFITLNAEDILVLNSYLKLFSQCGISIEQVGINLVVVKEVPLFIKNISLKDVIFKSISLVKENNNLEKDKLNNIIKEKIHSQVSCKSAIKAGEVLQVDTMHNLIKDLYNVENKLTCPHGRPTLYNLSISDIERLFKRNYKQKIDTLFL